MPTQQTQQTHSPGTCERREDDAILQLEVANGGFRKQLHDGVCWWSRYLE